MPLNKSKGNKACHEYYLTHKVEGYHRTFKEKDKLKMEVITHYGGGKCACVKCGYANIAALSIGHINDNGAEDRNHDTRAKIGTEMYRWLRKNDYPDGYQTLCMNCQWVKQQEIFNRRRTKNK